MRSAALEAVLLARSRAVLAALRAGASCAVVSSASASTLRPRRATGRRSRRTARRGAAARRRCRRRRLLRREGRRPVEQRVDLLHARLDRDELGAALDDEARVEPVALVHLEREAAEVAKPLLAHLEQRLALALELASGWDDVRGRAATSPVSTLAACESLRALPLRAQPSELEDDEPLFRHLADRVRRALARVAGVLDAAVRHLVGAERRRLVDRDAAELELAALRAARP